MKSLSKKFSQNLPSRKVMKKNLNSKLMKISKKSTKSFPKPHLSNLYQLTRSKQKKPDLSTPLRSQTKTLLQIHLRTRL